MRRAIIIFTRVPEAGKTKTRMMPRLSGKECERLHTAFLKDIRAACEQAEADIFVCYTPEGDGRRKLSAILGEQTGYFPQQGGGLGERMYRALATVLEKGYEACLLIGTDVPELCAAHLRRAFDVLGHRDVVFGRTADGGYYLVGMRTPRREVFEIPDYGHEKVWEDTLRHLRECRLSVGYTGCLRDMDTPEDLNGYRERMRGNRRLQRTETGRLLMRTSRISIIIPTYNEEKTIEALLGQLEELRGKCEILFVDGGSTDRTLELMDGRFPVIHSGKGRANQMNEGARASTGDVLFFLHCDSELPARPLAQIRSVMKDYRAGCFGIAFHSRHFFMLTCRVISNHRIKDRKVMFGDQGIFIDRKLFFAAGMFPELPIMEDYQFSLTLKEMGVRLGIAPNRIYTSDRRFPDGTIPKLRVMWKMNRLRKMYRDGVDIEKISRMYRDIR